MVTFNVIQFVLNVINRAECLYNRLFRRIYGAKKSWQLDLNNGFYLKNITH